MIYDCVLISPPSRMMNHYKPPLSLIHLGGYLTHKGLKVKIIDVPMKQVVRTKRFWKNKDTLVNRIKEQMLTEVRSVNTHFLGISCYSPEYPEVREFIFDLKKVSKAKIIVGGVHPTLCPKDFNDISDYIVRGLGEMCLYGIITGGKRTEAKIDEFSFPNYDLVDMNYYTQANPYCIRGVYLRATYLLAGYGCPSSCTFCVAKTLRPFFGSGEIRNPKNIMNDILYLKDKYKIDGFYFIDDLFTLDKKKVLDFCSLLVGKDLIWGCSSKVTTLNEEMIKQMSEAGCVQIDFGVERGSNESLTKLKKGQTVEKIREVFNSCKRHRIRVFANMLVNIPGETTQDLLDITKLLSNIRPDVTSVNIYRGYLGTELPDQEPDKRTLRFARDTTKRFSPISRNFKFHSTKRYLNILKKSKRKWNYFTQLGSLINEVVNQTLA